MVYAKLSRWLLVCRLNVQFDGDCRPLKHLRICTQPNRRGIAGERREVYSSMPSILARWVRRPQRPSGTFCERNSRGLSSGSGRPARCRRSRRRASSTQLPPFRALVTSVDTLRTPELERSVLAQRSARARVLTMLWPSAAPSYYIYRLCAALNRGLPG